MDMGVARRCGAGWACSLAERRGAGWGRRGGAGRRTIAGVSHSPITSQLQPNYIPIHIPIISQSIKNMVLWFVERKKENIMNIFLIQNNKNIDFYELGYNWDIDWDVDWDVVGV